MKRLSASLFWITILAIISCLVGCTPTTADPIPTKQVDLTVSAGGASEPPASEEASVITFDLTSTAFTHKGAIPALHSCKDKDTSPPLSWSGAPADVKSYALIVDDPDAPSGTWIHWVYFNIPGQKTSLDMGVSREKEFMDGSRNGENSWGSLGYDGPCPPSGTHRYFFKLYALDTILSLDPGASKPEVLKAMQGHTLGMAELMGTFSK